MHTLPLLVMYIKQYQQREGFYTSPMLGGDVRSLIWNPYSLPRTMFHSALCHADYSLNVASPPHGQCVHHFSPEEHYMVTPLKQTQGGGNT